MTRSDDAVSRETPPPAAATVFGAELGRARAFADVLAEAGTRRGLIGPREASRLWSRHLLNCAVIASAFPPGATVCDLGSGAGLPGVPVALVRPDLRVTLLEPLLRRETFLREAVDRLGLADAVSVVRARAEDIAGQAAYDAVMARAVAALPRLAAWGLPLVRPGGFLLAMKGARAESELSESVSTLRRLGASLWQVERYGAGVIEPLTTCVRVARG